MMYNIYSEQNTIMINNNKNFEYVEQVNILINSELNLWLNSVSHITKKTHGSKIPKGAIIAACLKYCRYKITDWTTIKTADDLLETLKANT